MTPKKTTLAALAGSALLGATAVASAAPTNGCCSSGSRTICGTPTGNSLSNSNSITVEQLPGQNPVLVINGQRINEDNIELTPDGRVLVHDGQGNTIDVLSALQPMMPAGLNTGMSHGAPVAVMPVATNGWPGAQQFETKPVIGVRLQRVSPGLAAQLGLNAGTGLLIAAVHPDMPAAQAGLQRWDVITSIGGEQVGSADALTAMLSSIEPETGITLDCIRQGVATTITVAPTMVQVPARQEQMWANTVVNQRDVAHMQAMMQQAANQQAPGQYPNAGSYGYANGGLHDHGFPGDGYQQMNAIPAPTGARPTRRRQVPTTNGANNGI